MIKNVITNRSHPYLQIETSQPGVYISPGAQSAGMMRFNTSSNQYEVYDGVSWKMISSTASVDFTQRTIDVLQWAEKKMLEDQKIKELVSQNPTVADAYVAYQQAAEKLQIAMALTQ